MFRQVRRHYRSSIHIYLSKRSLLGQEHFFFFPGAAKGVFSTKYDHNIPYKIYLGENVLLQNCYNVYADMKVKPAPPLNTAEDSPVRSAMVW